MNLKELTEKLKGLTDEADALLAKETLTEDEEARSVAILPEIESVRAKIKTAKAVKESRDWLDQPADDDPPVMEIREDAKIEAGDNRAAKRPYADGVPGFGEFLRDIRDANIVTEARERLEFRSPTGMSESVPMDGGFAVGTEQANVLLEKTREQSDVVGRCTNIPIGAGFDSVTLPRVDESSRADGYRAGGVLGYWRPEASQMTATKPKLGELKLQPEDLTGMCYLTDRLLADASALGAFVQKEFASEFAFKLNDAIVNGDGNGMPLGILNAACKVEVSKETAQDADTIVYQNVVKMWARMYGPSRRNAVWLMNQDIEPQLLTMSLAVGTGGSAVYTPAGGASAAPYSTLLGKPIIPMEQCQTVGDAGDIILADLSQYYTADKGGMQSASSIHIRFDYNETAFRFVYRFDGKPWWSSALTPANSSNTLSPFVTLAARA